MAHLSNLCKLGRLDEAFEVINHMCEQGLAISRETVYSLLQECIKRKELSVVRQVHSLLVSSGLDSISILGDHLIRLFASCGSLQEANLVFGKVAQPTVYTWNAIISAHATLGESERAFELYERLTNEGTVPDKFIFLSLLKACSSTRALAQGESIHKQIIQRGLESDIIIGSTLVDMYAKCGNLEKARGVFDAMQIRDTVAWNSMISSYVHHGRSFSALELFNTMQKEGVNRGKVTFLCSLKACSVIADLRQGKFIHEQIIRSGLASDVVVGSSLIDMYAKCGSLGDAHKVFDSLPDQNVVSWGAMISGYALHGHGLPALVLFDEMQQRGIRPDKVIFTCILKACGSIGAIGQAKSIHKQVIQSGFESDVVVGNSLFDMYAKCGSLEEARKVFDEVQNRDSVSWCTMIAGYAQHGHGLSALELYNKMQQEGVAPDEFTYSSILKACGTVGAFGQGKLIHDRFLGGFELDVIVGNTLIDMYAKCGNLQEARTVFDSLQTPNVVSWNTIITGYVQHGQDLLAFKIFEKMLDKGVEPTIVTFLGTLKACGSVGAIQHGELLHNEIIRSGLASEVAICNTLIDMYAKCGSLEVAWKVFNGMPDRSIVSWGAMICGCVQAGHCFFALDLFKHMQQEGIKPDEVTLSCVLKACGSIGAVGQGKLLHDWLMESGLEVDVLVGNALLDMYAKCGCMDEACELFSNLRNRDIASWNAMIAGHNLNGQGLPALELFKDMQQQGIKPDKITFLCILKACSSIGAIKQGKHIHDQIIRSGLAADVAIWNTLVELYAKCGNVQDAQDLFNKFSNRDVASWSIIIALYAQHGKCDLARQCLEDMQQEGLKPDAPIYSSILAACSHAGLVNEAYMYFNSMREDNGITPTIEHFNCLVDVLGRAGRLKEAELLLQTMPNLSSIPALMSLLSACRSHGEVELGRECFNQVVQLDPNSAAGYSLMSNIYADAYMWEEVQEMQELKNCSGVWKMPGKACVEIDGKVHDFTAGDKTHLECGYVFSKLSRLKGQIQEDGYVPQVDLW